MLLLSGRATYWSTAGKVEGVEERPREKRCRKHEGMNCAAAMKYLHGGFLVGSFTPTTASCRHSFCFKQLEHLVVELTASKTALAAEMEKIGAQLKLAESEHREAGELSAAERVARQQVEDALKSVRAEMETIQAQYNRLKLEASDLKVGVLQSVVEVLLLFIVVTISIFVIKI